MARLFDVYGPHYAEHLAESVRDRIALADDVYVFGAGRNGRMVVDRLRAAGCAPRAFVDDTPEKVGTLVDGVPVVAADALRGERSALVVVSIYLAHHEYLSIAQRLRRLGANTVSVLQFLWALGTDELPFYFHAPPDALPRARADLLWLAGMLADAASAAELLAHVEFRLSLQHEVLPAWTPHRLDAPAGWDEIGFVDAGAFDGDTLVPFLTSHANRTSYALALEPDPATHIALRANVAALPTALRSLVEPVECALDAATGTAAFAGHANAGSMLSATGATAVRTVSLDELLADRPAGRLYVKMDVEGAEANAIQGGAATIRERAPLLAISVYHRPNDLWELPRQIAQLNGGYRFMLRSHGADGADLTAYAVPPAA